MIMTLSTVHFVVEVTFRKHKRHYRGHKGNRFVSENKNAQ